MSHFDLVVHVYHVQHKKSTVSFYEKKLQSVQKCPRSCLKESALRYREWRREKIKMQMTPYKNP
ncbi:hypothetical protein T4D_14012 [Trichinella pseudospiralis]|uniref:Uncharacterized protein n=1 Tax=Trichinella pseudospiralis TaxID=6337 RepID=A0A0V1F3T3_TRIPS|nr:hypothetical protein T4D_14012 [Trichinella pseudospiralis]